MARFEEADGRASGGRNPFSGYVASQITVQGPAIIFDKNVPGTIIYNRTKDQGSATGQWFSALVQPNPWYKDVVPDVCDNMSHLANYILISCHDSSEPSPIAN